MRLGRGTVGVGVEEDCCCRTRELGGRKCMLGGSGLLFGALWRCASLDYIPTYSSFEMSEDDTRGSSCTNRTLDVWQG